MPSFPRAPAWFRHHPRPRSPHHTPHLGILDPTTTPPRFLDAGPADELALLTSDSLSSTALRTLLDAPTTTPLPASPPPRFLTPVARPSKILCLGKNFAAHAAEFGTDVPPTPLFFNKLPDTLLPHASPVLLPHHVHSRIDHEIELAVILGFPDPHHRGRRHVPPHRAPDLVAGYTILNDITARRIQSDDRAARHPWLRSKSFDTFCPIGPWVVPRHDLPDLSSLTIQLRVNDRTRQHSTLGLMVVDVPHAISWLSRHTTLRPGDIIAMGTPEGVGPIDHGDVMEGEIEDIGILRNPVLREARPPSP